MDRIAIDEEWSRYSPWRTIDRYEPCFELASGGMGTVFLARVTARAALHRFVALKRIHPHLVKEPGFVEMFLDEAHVASRIVHPNVCSVFDFDADGGRPYIAMEYLMGEPLTHVARALSQLESPADVERACRLAARVVADACEGLHAAHELRDAHGEPLHVVHRDVSPQNLFLTYDGAVKVVDFGLVRMAQCLHKTKTGIVKGKFGYLAPEAVAMKPLDRRADVWGLGVVLWELLAGRRLFQRATEVDTVVAVAQAQIPPPSTVRAGVPPEIDAIVLCALARNPDERYPTARALGRDLVAFLHGGPEPVGLSDVAEWTDRLFPRGRERKQELLEIAGQMLSERVGRAVPSSVRPVLPSPPPDAEELDTPTHARSVSFQVSSTPPPPPPRPRRASQAPSERRSSGPPSRSRHALRPPAPPTEAIEAPAHACSTFPRACSPLPRPPARESRWPTPSTTFPALVLAVVVAAAGGFAVASRRGGAMVAPPSSSPEAARPPAHYVAAEAAAVGLPRALLPSLDPAEGTGASCTAGRDNTMVLEVVSPGEAEPRRILVRPVPQPTRGP